MFSRIQLILSRRASSFISETRSQGSYNAINAKFLSTNRELKPTFTPYANPLKCSAHCHYCSEDLKLANCASNSSPKNLIKEDSYYNGLEKCIAYVNHHFGSVDLSFSGLEATLDKKFYYSTLSVVAKNDLFSYKTLYTNGSGIVLHNLDLSMFNKVEMHRDHYDESINQKIMRFEKQYAVINNDNFVALSSRHKNLWLVCILTKLGIQDMDGMTNYILFAKKAGFAGVIFRELAKLNNSLYDQNYTLSWINNNRVTLNNLKLQVDCNPMFHMIDNKVGYYYQNTTYTYENFTVVLEQSDYNQLNELEEEQKIHKLVYFSNGNLCNGWNPNNNIIKNFGDATRRGGRNTLFSVPKCSPEPKASHSEQDNTTSNGTSKAVL